MVGRSDPCFQGWKCFDSTHLSDIWRLARPERYGYVSSGGYDAFVWLFGRATLGTRQGNGFTCLDQEYVDITSTCRTNSLVSRIMDALCVL